MKLNRLSFLSICFGALVLQACSHAPPVILNVFE